MPDEPQIDAPSGRRTGEAAAFLNNAKLIAQQKVTAANIDRAAVLEAAHRQAKAALSAAHLGAADLMGKNLEYVCMRIESGSGGHWMIFDARGSVKEEPSWNGAPGVAVAADRAYWVDPDSALAEAAAAQAAQDARAPQTAGDAAQRLEEEMQRVSRSFGNMFKY
jgi:hypothetical protein